MQNQTPDPIKPSFKNLPNWFKIKSLAILSQYGIDQWINAKEIKNDFMKFFQETPGTSKIHSLFGRYLKYGLVYKKRIDESDFIIYHLTAKGIKRLTYLYMYFLPAQLREIKNDPKKDVFQLDKIMQDFLAISNLYNQMSHNLTPETRELIGDSIYPKQDVELQLQWEIVKDYWRKEGLLPAKAEKERQAKIKDIKKARVELKKSKKRELKQQKAEEQARVEAATAAKAAEMDMIIGKLRTEMNKNA